MTDETENSNSTESGTGPAARELATSGYIERTILHHLAGPDPEPRRPSTVGEVLPAIAAVIRRGDYANIAPNGATEGTVRKSAIRRSFTQLEEKGLVRRVTDLSEAERRSSDVDLGTCDGDSGDLSGYSRLSDDARVTDWILTADGVREVERLDARYTAELDELAGRYGRPPGETTTRIDT